MATSLYAEAFKYRGSVKKDEAETIVAALGERHPESRQELAMLLAYFMPKAPKGKTVEAWVGSAAAKKDIRAYLRFVCATGSEIVATDGHVLHKAPSELPRGLYDPVSMVKVWDLQEDCEASPAGHPGKFPDYPRFIPKRQTAPLGWLPQEVIDKGRLRVTQGDKSADFIPEQFELAASRCTRGSIDGPNDSMLFEGDNGEVAVVMPLRGPKKK